MCIFVCVCLSVYQSVCVYICLFVCRFVCLSVCLSICESVYLTIYLSVCLPAFSEARSTTTISTPPSNQSTDTFVVASAVMLMVLFVQQITLHEHIPVAAKIATSVRPLLQTVTSSAQTALSTSSHSKQHWYLPPAATS